MARRALAVVVCAVLLGACHSAPRNPPPQLEGGDPARGAELITSYGCATCHVVPGVRGADGLVGPPLTSFRRRGFIAGELSNTPDHLIEWIRFPQSVEHGTAMPDLGVTEIDARDIAAYLYTLN
ncbi:MAG: cytochrome c family protein [Actinomycetota bacterium]